MAVRSWSPVTRKSRAAAGVTTVPDELLSDSNGLAAEIVARSFGTAIGRKIDATLLDGDGVGKPVGVLQAAGVNHVGVTSQGAEGLFDAIAGAISRLRAKFFEPTAVVMRPEIMLRFTIARTAGDGHFLFGEGLADRLGVTVVFDSNLPVDGTGLTSIIVAEWASALYFFSRGGLVIESSEAPAFVSDETTFRAYERHGAAVVKPDAIEVLDDVDVSP
jgi:HK97 family phage major capsid protein